MCIYVANEKTKCRHGTDADHIVNCHGKRKQALQLAVGQPLNVDVIITDLSVIHFLLRQQHEEMEVGGSSSVHEGDTREVTRTKETTSPRYGVGATSS